MSAIGYRNPRFYQARQTMPRLDSPKAQAPLQAANEPRPANEQTPPLDWSKTPSPPCEHGENTGDKLRAAIREIAAAREVNQISTRKVLLALIERKGEPWPALWGRDIARGNLRGPAAQLARLLKPFGIAAQTIREPDGYV